MSAAEKHAADAARFAELIDSACADDWSRQSPVREWVARDVVEHLIGWLPGFVEPMGVSLSPVDVGDLAAAWRQRTADVQRLLETQGDVEFDSPQSGRTTIAAMVDRFYTADVWMHSWDLARALGQQFDLGEERCAAALTAMEPGEQAMRSSGHFGPRVEVPPDASAQDKLLGFIGRDPHWQP